MGTEDDPKEEQQEVLSFHHLLIMEFVAAKYISTLSEVSYCFLIFWHFLAVFLSVNLEQRLKILFQADLLALFPIKRDVEVHQQVLYFASGLSDNVGVFINEHFSFCKSLACPRKKKVIKLKDLKRLFGGSDLKVMEGNVVLLATDDAHSEHELDLCQLELGVSSTFIQWFGDKYHNVRIEWRFWC